MSLRSVIDRNKPSEQVALGGRLRVLTGKVDYWLPNLPAGHFDAALSDPPYELDFMGLHWDRSGVAFKVETWQAVLRCLKPGAHAALYGGTRTFHRMMVAAEDAGFYLVDVCNWAYGQGFPKGTNIALQIDKRNGVDVPSGVPVSANRAMAGPNYTRPDKGGPVTPAAKRWAGYNTALKPAWEPLVILRRPGCDSFAENVLLYETGGLNIAPCRIGTEPLVTKGGSANRYVTMPKRPPVPANRVQACHEGRFPANVMFSHHPLCRRLGTTRVKANTGTAGRGGTGRVLRKGIGGGNGEAVGHGHVPANGRVGQPSAERRYTNKGATRFAALPGRIPKAVETVEHWACAPMCPIRMLDAQVGHTVSRQAVKGKGSAPWTGPNFKNKVYGKGMGGPLNDGNTHADEGGVSRFFFHPKVARAERNAGCGGMAAGDAGVYAWAESRDVVNENDHATLKPIDLCRYFATLILPPPRPKGKAPRRILVPFAGTLSEAIGCLLAGWDEVVAIEMDPKFVRTGLRRAAEIVGKGKAYDDE